MRRKSFPRVPRGFIAATRRAARRGALLLIVLVVVSLLSLGVYSFTERMVSEAEATASYGRGVMARSMAESGIEMAAAQLSTRTEYGVDTLSNNPDLFMGLIVQDAASDKGRGRYTLITGDESDPEGRTVRYGLSDESGKLNLNALMKMNITDDQRLTLLIGLPGMTEEIADAILDWIDSDDEPRPFGAESDYYETLDPPYYAKNGPLESIDELLKVRGVTPELLYGEDANSNGLLDANEADGSDSPPFDNGDQTLDLGWTAYLTTFSREVNRSMEGLARIDLNQALLTDLYDQLEEAFDEDVAKFVVAYRMNGAQELMNAAQGANPGSGGTGSGGGGGGRGAGGNGGRGQGGNGRGGQGGGGNGGQGNGGRGGQGAPGGQGNGGQGNGGRGGSGEGGRGGQPGNGARSGFPGGAQGLPGGQGNGQGFRPRGAQSRGNGGGGRRQGGQGFGAAGGFGGAGGGPGLGGRAQGGQGTGFGGGGPGGGFGGGGPGNFSFPGGQGGGAGGRGGNGGGGARGQGRGSSSQGGRGNASQGFNSPNVSGANGGFSQQEMLQMQNTAASLASALFGANGQTGTITRGGMNLAVPAINRVNSIYDLVGVSVQVTINGAQQTLQSPWPAEPGTMSDIMPMLVDRLATSAVEFVDGRINVNQARPEILIGVPGMTEEILDGIMAARNSQSRANDAKSRATIGWMFAEGIVDLATLRALDPYLTTQGDVYRVQSVGFFDGGGPQIRLEAVIDATLVPSRIISLRDLSQLGRGYSLDQLLPQTGTGLRSSL